MYKLSSSDLNNDNMIKALEKSESANKIRSASSLNKIQYMIFSEDITNEAIYKTALASLTLGDELKIPINKNIVDILYFALCVNSDNKIGLKITNISQASILYEMYKNDFKKVELEDNKTRIRFTTLEGYHPVFFPGYSITWKIPVSFFKANDKNQVTLSGLNYCIVIINNIEYKIPRLMYQKFFRSSMTKGRLICDTTEEIKDKFDFSNNDALYEIFSYIGYVRKKELQNIKLPMGQNFIQEGKIISFPSDKKEMDIYWQEISSNKYILLPKLEYVPLINSSEPLLVNLLTE